MSRRHRRALIAMRPVDTGGADPATDHRALHDRTPHDPALVADRSNWITLVYDTRHAVAREGAVAYRAITSRGEPLWFVLRAGKARGYHAETVSPRDAIELAWSADRRRRDVRARWSEVRKLARDLRAGRRRLAVRIEDAYASPLCPMGIRYFLRSVGLGRVRRLPGTMAGWLMLVDEQVGFVIHEAARREARVARSRIVDGRGDGSPASPPPSAHPRPTRHLARRRDRPQDHAQDRS